MAEHPMLGKLIKKISAKERESCEQFLRINEDLNSDNFAHKCNRWMLNETRPKNYSAMWAIVSQCK